MRKHQKNIDLDQFLDDDYVEVSDEVAYTINGGAHIKDDPNERPSTRNETETPTEEPKKEQEEEKKGLNFFKKWINNIQNSSFYYKITKFHFEDRDALNIITESYDDIIKDASNLENPNRQWELLPIELSLYHQNGEGSDEKKVYL